MRRRTASLLVLALTTACTAAEHTGPESQAPHPTQAAIAHETASAVPAQPAPNSAGSDATSQGPSSGAPGAEARAPITSQNDFTLAMLRALEKERDNVFYSGTSLRSALGMTALGAKGDTLSEMTAALAVEADPAANVASAKREAAEWKRAAGKTELHIGSRLFVERSFALAAPFREQTKSGYGAGVGLQNFEHASEQSRQDINRWVSDQTKQRITDLLPEGSITPLTRMVLTNAIYFKGSWATEFPKGATRDAPFHAPTGSVNVPTMHRKSDMRYEENDEVSLVELPYKNSDLALLVALPTENTTLATVVRELTDEKLARWARSLETRELLLALPKFEFRWGRSVKKDLQGMGVRKAFTEDADFSAMNASGTPELFVDDVFHKGFVLVDEVGTEAAAATAVVMRTKSAMKRTLELHVDRPFLFFVRNVKTGDVLFAGRVSNPKRQG